MYVAEKVHIQNLEEGGQIDMMNLQQQRESQQWAFVPVSWVADPRLVKYIVRCVWNIHSPTGSWVGLLTRYFTG